MTLPLWDSQAYRLNLFGARYQWIIADGGVAGWRLVRQAAGCTAHSVLLAADGSIRLQIRQLSHTNAPGVSGRVGLGLFCVCVCNDVD